MMLRFRHGVEHVASQPSIGFFVGPSPTIPSAAAKYLEGEEVSLL